MTTPFPALTTPQGYIFLVTYAYSGASKLISKINSRDGYEILGDLGAPIVPMASAHSSLQRYAVSTAVGQEMRHQMLGWAMAENFAHNIMNAHKSTGVTGLTLSCGDVTREDLNNALLFLYSHFPKARFIFLTRRTEEVHARHKQRRKEHINARINNLNNIFLSFHKNFPDLSMVQSFNQLGNSRSLDNIDDFLTSSFGDSEDRVRQSDE
jgi:hypothetical protein